MIENEIQSSRTCGPCYACCVHLGIEELEKFPGISCKHLDGRKGPEKRCGIYSQRPRACQTYFCGWVAGIGGEDFRPDRSGMLISLYPPNIEGEIFSVSIHVIDQDLCGSIGDVESRIGVALRQIIESGCNDIRIVWASKKKVIHFLQGKIRAGRLLPPEGPEELTFESWDPPIGTYLLEERK